jgi:hypothetical protein
MICSLSGKHMINPVDGNDGYTYELIELLYWLQKNNVSPKTGKKMELTDLITNISLRKQRIKKKTYPFPISFFMSFLQSMR